MPRGIDMRHHMNGPAAREWFIGIAAGIFRTGIEAAADAGIGTKQRDRAEQPLSLLDHVADVLFLRHVAFESGAVDSASDGPCAGGFLVGDDDLGRTRAMKGL